MAPAATCGQNLARSAIPPEMMAGMHAANFDMLRHYRPTQNVVTRPVAPGHGHAVIGQHEILLPLLRQALIEEWRA